jgi:hypothetical protein
MALRTAEAAAQVMAALRLASDNARTLPYRCEGWVGALKEKKVRPMPVSRRALRGHKGF